MENGKRNNKKSIHEVIIVEGRYDKSTVAQVVDATIVETSGFGVFSDEEKLTLIRKLAEKRGLVILTDSDSGGFFIRGRLRGILGELNVKHAYIPDVPGRERRKSSPGKEGKLGVEGMSTEVIITALELAGATFIDETMTPGFDSAFMGDSNAKQIKIADYPQERTLITKADLYAAGLTGGVGSKQKRLDFQKSLGLPEKLPVNGLLDVLNVLYTRVEFLEL